MNIIDGSKFEGGGSILRVAIGIAAGVKEPVKVINIRAKRKKKGLRVQHILGIDALQEITNSTVIGNELGSEVVEFYPKKHVEKSLTIKPTTAASITLLLQSLQNYVAITGKKVKGRFFGGGTHVPFSPSIEYINNVTRFGLLHFGVHLDINVNRLGFYPSGGAEGSFLIEKEENFEKVHLTQKESRNRFKAYVIASEYFSEKRVAERISRAFKQEMENYEGEVHILYKPGNKGIAFTGVLQGKIPIGVVKLGDRKVSAEKIGKTVAQELKNNRGVIIGKYLSDQLLVPFAFSQPGSKIKIRNTSHVKANIFVIEQLLGNIISKNENRDWIELVKL